MSKLDGKTALITGGGSGIGLATARLFLQEGARVVISGRNEEKLAKACRELGGDRVSHHAADVGDSEQVRRLIEEATRRLGRIDILVNNAGLNFKDRAIRQLTPERWQNMMRANLDGAFYCTHYVLPQMLERGDGMIVNVSSVAGKRAIPLSGAAYAASKFGMTALGLCLGAEELNSGVRVSNIYPGEVDTPILEHRPQPLTEEHRAKILKAEDVAAAILFVATLPPRVSVPELVIKPTTQMYL